MLPAARWEDVATQVDASAGQAALHCGAQPQDQRCSGCTAVHPAPSPPGWPELLSPTAGSPKHAQISSHRISRSQRGHRDSEASAESLRAVCEQGLPPAVPL